MTGCKSLIRYFYTYFLNGQNKKKPELLSPLHESKINDRNIFLYSAKKNLENLLFGIFIRKTSFREKTVLLERRCLRKQ